MFEKWFNILTVGPKHSIYIVEKIQKEGFLHHNNPI